MDPPISLNPSEKREHASTPGTAKKSREQAAKRGRKEGPTRPLRFLNHLYLENPNVTIKHSKSACALLIQTLRCSRHLLTLLQSLFLKATRQTFAVMGE